jgi:hypothetical protein
MVSRGRSIRIESWLARTFYIEGIAQAVEETLTCILAPDIILIL